MPTQVQTRPQNDRVVSPHHIHDPHSIVEHDLANRNAIQRDALHLALGSILAPKRNCSHSPGSRSGSTSGTASPAHPWHFPSAPSPNSPLGTPGPVPPPPHPTPNYSHGHLYAPQSHGHSHLHPNPHTNYPSRFGLSRSNSEDAITKNNVDTSISDLPSSGTNHIQHGFEYSPLLPDGTTAPQHSHGRAPSVTVSPPTIHAPAPQPPHDFRPNTTSTRNGDHSETHAEGGTPKAKWIETLQSKRAWDALIHGSFS